MIVVMASVPITVIVVVVPIVVIAAVVPIVVVAAVVIICTAMYTPMNTPMMAIVGLRLVHGQ